MATLASANQRDVLIRVVGPSLQQFGLTDAMADPNFLVVSPKLLGFTEFHYSDWSSIVYYGLPGEPPTTRHSDPNPAGVAAFQKIFSYVGAFPLLDGSKDAADVLRLAPGSYTVVVDTPTADSTGEVLIEVYLLP